MSSYKDIFQAFHKADLQYLIVGGVAMNLLGCPRFTNDIDVLLALNEDNLHIMNHVMESMGYEASIPVSLEELGDEKNALKLIKEKNLLAYSFHSSTAPLFSVDVIVGPSLQFDQYKKDQVRVDSWDLSLPVISIDNLIGMKKETDREKDALDVAMLLEYKGL
jgi:hypothetical protein